MKYKFGVILSMIVVIVLWMGVFYNAFFLLQVHSEGKQEKVHLRKDYSIEKLRNNIDLASAFEADIFLKNRSHFSIIIEGDVVFSTDRNRPEDIVSFNNSTHQSATYCLAFVRNVLAKGKVDSLSDEHWWHILKIIHVIIEDGKRVPNLNKYIYYDHPVAERLETLILVKMYLEQRKPELAFPYDGAILQLVSLLAKNDFFNFRMNHGLMQLRAQLFYSFLTRDYKNVEQVEERLNDVIGLYVNEDGSILEAATGYQLYIYEQFKALRGLFILINPGNNTLAGELDSQRQYLASLVNVDGFLQGMGDSYSQIINDPFFRSDSGHIFRYSNKIAGVDAKTHLGEAFALQFVSFDNKPHVHKLPEDLGVYIYYGQPFFANTGTYSYEDEDSRRFVLSEESQNGPKFGNKEIASSNVFISSNPDPNVIGFSGYVASKDDTIFRSVSVNKRNLVVRIQDRSTTAITSQYILDPSLTVSLINDSTLYLEGKCKSFKLIANGPVHVGKSWVASGYQEKQEVKIIRLEGEMNTVMLIPGSPDSLGNIEIAEDSKEGLVPQSRAAIAETLKEKYPFSLVVGKIRNTGILFISVFLFISALLFWKNWNKLQIVFNVFLCIVLLYDLTLDHLFIIEFVYNLRNQLPL